MSNEQTTDEGDSVYAPGVRKLLSEVEEALDEGDEQRARERITQAHGALLESRADSLDMNPAVQEALESAVEHEDFVEELPIGRDEIPEEWETEQVPFEEAPIHVDRDVQELAGEGLFRITIEPSSRRGDAYGIRYEKLPYEPKA